MSPATTNDRVRPGHPADHDAIVGLEGLSGSTRRLLASDLADRERRTVVVAQRRGAIVGFAMANRQPDEVHLLDLAVGLPARRRGLARRLVAALAGAAQRDGASAMTLEVRVSNGSARRLYDSLGFATAGVRRGYYRDGEDAVIMWHHDLAALRRRATSAATHPTAGAAR